MAFFFATLITQEPNILVLRATLPSHNKFACLLNLIITITISLAVSFHMLFGWYGLCCTCTVYSNLLFFFISSDFRTKIPVKINGNIFFIQRTLWCFFCRKTSSIYEIFYINLNSITGPIAMNSYDRHFLFCAIWCSATSHREIALSAIKSNQLNNLLMNGEFKKYKKNSHCVFLCALTSVHDRNISTISKGNYWSACQN